MAAHRVWSALAVAAAALAIVPDISPGAGAAQPVGQRTIVVIGDLHMGRGRDDAGRWRPDEDFRWAADFSRFLRAIDSQHRSTIDLVLNGDTFELPAAEPQALARLDGVLAAHKTEIDALATFANAGTNRVILVAGDRDSALSFAAVADRVRRAVPGSAGRVSVAPSGYVSPDGRVHAEHGHEIRLPSADPAPLRELHERLEGRYPTLDNLAILGGGPKYALAADATLASTEAAAFLVRDALLNVSWQQFRMELDDGEVQPPQWDLAQARRQGAALLVSALPDDDPLKPLAAKLEAGGGLSGVSRDLTDQEITAVCDYRAAVRRARRRFEPVVTQFAPRGPVVTECQRTPDTRGAIFEYFWRSRDELYGAWIERIRRSNSRSVPTVFVIGHTHLADRTQSYANMISGGLLKIPMEGFSPVRGALTPIVINGGAWNRTITPVQLERLHHERAGSWDRFLRSLEPEQLSPCYSFVLVPAYGQELAPAVRYWRRSADGAWSISPACGG